MPKVSFVNEQITVEAATGETLLQIAERSQINVFRGLFQEIHCGRRLKGWCGRCKLWATPLAAGAVNEKSSNETAFRIGGRVPKNGTMRLACQVVVSGDVEVRTRSGFEIAPSPATWEADPRPSKWRDRWDHRNDEPDEDEKPKKKAAPAKAAAVATKPAEAATAAATSTTPAATPATAATTPTAAAQSATGGGNSES